MIAFSVLDLTPVIEGATPREALANTLDLARNAERLGFHRYWLAEHHNMPGIASAATAVVIGHVAQGTQTIRVGAGGIMLPNHAPLQIAEQFGTLESLFPGRIDLGLGRAPGTDQITAHALRRTLTGDVDRFPQDVVELLGYFQTAQPGQRVQAVPGGGLNVPVWILGSSLFGAQLAAQLGLPFAFASHFAPAQMREAIAIYRARFQPSPQLATPYVMLGYSVYAAETDEEAQYLATSQIQAIRNLRSGQPTRLRPPIRGFETSLAPTEAAMLGPMRRAMIAGSPETVRAALSLFIAETEPDELIVMTQMYDHAARVRSYEILADVHAQLAREQQAAA
jgi:luciferase family oxidoreductase group 1